MGMDVCIIEKSNNAFSVGISITKVLLHLLHSYSNKLGQVNTLWM